MNFIKKHYEKVLLGAVLAGLVVVAAILLPFKIATEEADLEKQRQDILAQHLVPLPPLNVSRSEEALKQLQNPARLNFAGPHNLFNPVPWQRRASDGQLIKVPQAARELGVQVIKVAPLYLTIALAADTVTASGYSITVEKETESSSSKRKMSGYVALNVKPAKLPVILWEVKGPPDNPSELILELSDSSERVSVAPGRPYRRVDGYTSDLRCDAENKTWRGQRVGWKLLFAGDEFTIIAINLVATNQFEVILSAKSTSKKSTIKFETKEDDTQKAAIKPSAAPKP